MPHQSKAVQLIIDMSTYTINDYKFDTHDTNDIDNSNRKKTSVDDKDYAWLLQLLFLENETNISIQAKPSKISMFDFISNKPLIHIHLYTIPMPVFMVWKLPSIYV